MKKKILINLFKFIYKCLCFFPLKNNRLIFVDGQNLNNVEMIVNEIEDMQDKLDYRVICKNRQMNSNRKVISQYSLEGIYYLATSKYWIVDSHLQIFLKNNIFPRMDTKYIQIWHATGAIKKFGQDSCGEYLDSKNVLIKESKIIDYIIIASELWKIPFSTAFGVEKEKIKILGSPRTDVFFKKDRIEKSKQEFFEKNPQLKGKKIILYAPTFRDNDIKNFKLKLDINYFLKELPENYILLIKLHPNISNWENKGHNDKRIKDFSNHKDINQLMFISDILITDYSSIALEYSLLNKPMIFYAYDYHEYKNDIRGFYYEYENFVPGEVVKNTIELIKVLKEKNYDYKKIGKFAKLNHDYHDGKSSRRLLEFIKSEIEGVL